MSSRALVLGGGGVTGIAWEIGLLSGLAAAGLDLTGADTVIGTSAGASVGAQITSDTALSTLYDRQIEGYANEIAARDGRGMIVAFIVAGLRSGRDGAKFRRNIGAKALRATTVPEADRLEVMRSRLPSHEWPDRRLLITAVDAATGEFVVFDRAAGVPLVDAVAASCAVPTIWPPVTIGARRYIDGGMRSAANADLAAGNDRVVVLAPIMNGAGTMTAVGDQVRDLTAGGGRVALVGPDAAARASIGRNSLDPARRAPAAKAGFDQAAGVIEEIRAVWESP